MMNDLNRKKIVRELLDTVYGVSSREYQERVWLKGLGPECDSYDETICNFFDTAKDVIKNYKEFKLTEYERDVLEEFWNVFDKFDNSEYRRYFEKDFIYTPQWEYVMKKAQGVIKAFKFVYKWDD